MSITSSDCKAITMVAKTMAVHIFGHSLRRYKYRRFLSKRRISKRNISRKVDTIGIRMQRVHDAMTAEQ